MKGIECVKWWCCVSYFLFFFSSRRRHTRYWRDWSSDVCSSDLKRPSTHPFHDGGRLPALPFHSAGRDADGIQRRSRARDLRGAAGCQIGRASLGKECRSGWLAKHYKKEEYKSGEGEDERD